MTTVTSAADFGSVLRERRVELGFSQRELARRVGVSRQWIVEIERGKERAEIGLLLRVLNALDLTVRVDVRPDDLVDLAAILDDARRGRP